MTSKVMIREVGCREGFQNLDRVVPTECKVKLIELLSECGLESIETTAFVRADRVPQMADAEEVVRRLAKRPGVTYTALYLNPRGFERAEEVGGLSNEGWIPAAVSEPFLRRNNNLTFEQFFDGLPAWQDAFRSRGKGVHGIMVSAAFGSNEEGSIGAEPAVDLIRKVEERLGAPLKEVCLADTMGWGTPDKVRRAVAGVRQVSPAEVSLHLHDTRGMGIANAAAGLEEGVRIFDSSVGGVGGCPFVKGAAGNVATEDLLFLCEAMGYSTGIDEARLYAAVEYLETVLGFPPPSRCYGTWRSLGRVSSGSAC